MLPLKARARHLKVRFESSACCGQSTALSDGWVSGMERTPRPGPLNGAYFRAPRWTVSQAWLSLGGGRTVAPVRGQVRRYGFTRSGILACIGVSAALRSERSMNMEMSHIWEADSRFRTQETARRKTRALDAGSAERFKQPVIRPRVESRWPAQILPATAAGSIMYARVLVSRVHQQIATRVRCNNHALPRSRADRRDHRQPPVVGPDANVNGLGGLQPARELKQMYGN
jgi:hypothetical protein